MKHATDVMETDLLRVSPRLTVQALAREMVDTHADGACVLESDRLIGVVTSMDLVFKEKRLHLPTFLTILEASIPLDFRGRTHKEMEKISGRYVEDIMTPSPRVAAPDTSLDQIATWMVEEHMSYIPVLEGDHVVGVVTRRGMLRSIAEGRPPEL